MSDWDRPITVLEALKLTAGAVGGLAVFWLFLVWLLSL